MTVASRTRWWRSPRALDAASVTAVLAAAVVLLLPTRDPAERAAAERPLLLRGGPASRAGLLSARVDTTALAIVAGNLFSASRRAPTARFTPPGIGGPVESTVGPSADAYPVGTSAAGAAIAAGDASERVPSLYGIVMVNDERRALLQLRPGAPPQLYPVGGGAFGYRVTRIDSAQVVLQTSTGAQTLRLRRPSRDSSSRLP